MSRNARYRRKLLMVMYQSRCCYCGVRVYERRARLPDTATIDHVIPKARGGTFRWENTVLACVACNEAKADGPATIKGMAHAQAEGASL